MFDATVDRPWSQAGERVVALAKKQDKNKLLFETQESKNISATSLASQIMNLPEELAAVLLARTWDREKRNIISMFALPGGLPFFDYDKTTRILSRFLTLMPLQNARKFLEKLWVDRPKEIFTELCLFDLLAAKAFLQGYSFVDLESIFSTCFSEVAVEENWSKAYQLRQQGKPKEALSLLIAALVKEPAHSGILVNFGNLCKDMDLLEQAEMAYLSAGGSKDALYCLGCLYMEQAGVLNYFALSPGLSSQVIDMSIARKAEEAFGRALKIDPEDADSANNLAIVLAQTGRNSEALEILQRALQDKPNDADMLANALKLKRRLEK